MTGTLTKDTYLTDAQPLAVTLGTTLKGTKDALLDRFSKIEAKGRKMAAQQSLLAVTLTDVHSLTMTDLVSALSISRGRASLAVAQGRAILALGPTAEWDAIEAVIKSTNVVNSAPKITDAIKDTAPADLPTALAALATTVTAEREAKKATPPAREPNGATETETVAPALGSTEPDAVESDTETPVVPAPALADVLAVALREVTLRQSGVHVLTREEARVAGQLLDALGSMVETFKVDAA